MKPLLIFFPFVAFIACAQNPQQQLEKVSMKISPGEVRWVTFPISKNQELRFNCKGQDIKFSRQGSVGHALVVADYFSDLNPFKCQLFDDGVVTHLINFKVEHREYKAEQLRVPPKTIKLSEANQQRALREQKMLNQIYASSSSKLLFTQPFIQPLNSVVTSLYGTRRVYNKTKAGQHLGTDYRAAIGDKIPAANRGKIVYAGDLFYTGGTVIIDHGLDIYTVYGHLSQTLVKEGDMVDRGQLIGLSGNTGRTSGPHLHWGVKVQGDYIDGFVLIDETVKNLSE